MKTIFMLLVSVLTVASVQAQTNTFPASGNVGIGTTSPGAALDVTGSARIGSSTDRPIVLGENYGSISIQGNSGGWAFGLHAKGSLGTWRGGFGFFGVGDDLQYSYIGDSYANPTVVVQPGNGNVGIGTANPTQKLSVNGTVRAKEVIVDSGWSDFVFDESYKLNALSETEAFIKSEKHLPGIPSAKEVVEHGVSVGEMQAKLLAKIEELTLHQIEQEKRLATQQKEIERLRLLVSK